MATDQSLHLLADREDLRAIRDAGNFKRPYMSYSASRGVQQIICRYGGNDTTLCAGVPRVFGRDTLSTQLNGSPVALPDILDHVAEHAAKEAVRIYRRRLLNSVTSARCRNSIRGVRTDGIDVSPGMQTKIRRSWKAMLRALRIVPDRRFTKERAWEAILGHQWMGHKCVITTMKQSWKQGFALGCNVCRGRRARGDDDDDDGNGGGGGGGDDGGGNNNDDVVVRRTRRPRRAGVVRVGSNSNSNDDRGGQRYGDGNQTYADQAYAHQTYGGGNYNNNGIAQRRSSNRRRIENDLVAQARRSSNRRRIEDDLVARARRSSARRRIEDDLVAQARRSSDERLRRARAQRQLRLISATGGINAQQELGMRTRAQRQTVAGRVKRRRKAMKKGAKKEGRKKGGRKK